MTDHIAQEPPDPEDYTDGSPDPATDTEVAVLCDLLQESGVQRVVFRYDGSGDSGCVDVVEYEPEDAAVPKWADERLHELAENYCPPGYENNEGGGGTLTLYPFLGLAEREHRDHFTDTEDMGVRCGQLPAGLRGRLLRLGVTTASAHFDGYGDSGNIEELQVEPQGITLGDGLRDALDDFLIERLPGGWENNAGGYGDFLIDVASGQVTVDAYWRLETELDAQVTRWKWRQ